MRINLDIQELQAFIAVAHRRSFKAAAESLFISQPALSRRIEKLETTLDARLLERTTRRVSLTETGRQFLEHAQVAVAALESALKGVSERAQHHTSLITVACVPSVANHLLPDVLGRLGKEHPKVRIRIIDESAGDVLAAVVSGQADFGVNFIGTQEADIDFEAIGTEHYLLVTGKDHPWATRCRIAWSELGNEKLISVSQRSGNRMLIDHALAQAGGSSPHRPGIFYETNHVAGALGLVAAGLGVAVIPELALSTTAHPNLVGIPLEAPAITRTLGLIRRKGSTLSPAAETLCQLIREAVQPGPRPPQAD